MVLEDQTNPYHTGAIRGNDFISLVDQILLLCAKCLDSLDSHTFILLLVDSVRNLNLLENVVSQSKAFEELPDVVLYQNTILSCRTMVVVFWL